MALAPSQCRWVVSGAIIKLVLRKLHSNGLHFKIMIYHKKTTCSGETEANNISKIDGKGALKKCARNLPELVLRHNFSTIHFPLSFTNWNYRVYSNADPLCVCTTIWREVLMWSALNGKRKYEKWHGRREKYISVKLTKTAILHTYEKCNKILIMCVRFMLKRLWNNEKKFKKWEQFLICVWKKF